MSYRLPKRSIPCKFEKIYTDWVPTPFGSGNCPMDSFECGYEGTDEIWQLIERRLDSNLAENCCTTECPGYAPVLTRICTNHDEEFVESCGECALEEERRYAELEGNGDRI